MNTVQLAPSRAGRVYLAGPMTGIAEFNFPAFHAAAAGLRASGIDVVNPAEHGIVDGAQWEDYLRFDIAKIAGCESIALLPGWSQSRGATLEVHVAKALGMPIIYLAGAERALGAGLTFGAFRTANVTRCLKWHPAGIDSWSTSDWMTAIMGELGEAASLIKMRNRERDGLPGNKFSPTQKQIADELADVLTYLDLLAAMQGIDLGHAAASKFNEVSERVGFPDRLEVPSLDGGGDA